MMYKKWRRPDLFWSPGGLFSLGTAPRPSPSGCARTSTGSIMPFRDPPSASPSCVCVYVCMCVYAGTYI